MSADDSRAFTIRIPSKLADLIEARAKIHHRSKNNEVITLLERAIEDTVTRDLSRSGPR